MVLKENRGTCSTKHALLAALAFEHNQPVFLMLGIYEMNGENTSGIGKILKKYNLESLLEAHCYLAYNGRQIDITRFSESEIKPTTNFIFERQIMPSQIGNYKQSLHRRFFRKWMNKRNMNKQFSFERLWNIREECIAALSQIV